MSRKFGKELIWINFLRYVFFQDICTLCEYKLLISYGTVGGFSHVWPLW